MISRAEAAVAAREFDEALACLDETGPLPDGSEPELALRAMLTGASTGPHHGRGSRNRMSQSSSVLGQPDMMRRKT